MLLHGRCEDGGPVEPNLVVAPQEYPAAWEEGRSRRRGREGSREDIREGSSLILVKEAGGTWDRTGSWQALYMDRGQPGYFPGVTNGGGLIVALYTPL